MTAIVEILIIWSLIFVAVDKSPLTSATEQTVFASACEKMGGVVLINPEWTMPECWIDKE